MSVCDSDCTRQRHRQQRDLETMARAALVAHYELPAQHAQFTQHVSCIGYGFLLPTHAALRHQVASHDPSVLDAHQLRTCRASPYRPLPMCICCIHPHAHVKSYTYAYAHAYAHALTKMHPPLSFLLSHTLHSYMFQKYAHSHYNYTHVYTCTHFDRKNPPPPGGFPIQYVP